MFNYLLECNFNDIISEVDCNKALSDFSAIILNAYNTCCPIKSKTISNKDLHKPWINRDLIQLMKIRSNFYSLYIRKKMAKIVYT